jgi:hypothetical protein
MFELNWSDPETRWLVITNWTLFAVTLICVGVVLYGVGIEIVKRVRQRAAGSEHVAVLPELGLTMADGGEKITRKNRNTK